MRIRIYILYRYRKHTGLPGKCSESGAGDSPCS